MPDHNDPPNTDLKNTTTELSLAVWFTCNILIIVKLRLGLNIMRTAYASAIFKMRSKAARHALLAPALIGSMAIGSVASAASTIVPNGDQQVHYYAYINSTPVVPETDIVSHDLSSPLTFSTSGPIFGVAVNSSAPGTPAVSALASTSPTGSGDYVYARSALDYYIYIAGPSTLDSVPIFYRSSLSATAGGVSALSGNEASVASANFTLEQYDANLNFVGFPVSQTVSVQNRYGSDSNALYSTPAGTVRVAPGSYLVSLITSEARVLDGGQASASADPYFQIDPAFSAAHPGYSLLFSEFAGNAAPAVPEPATWAMMLAGFGMIGFAARRRQSVNTSVRFA